MRQRQQLPDYRDSLPNLAQSILREFGITEVGRESLKSLDPYLGKVIKISLSFYWMGWGQKLWREVWRGMDSFSDVKKQTIIRYFHRLRLRPPHRSGVGFSRVSTVGLDGTATFRRSIRM